MPIFNEHTTDADWVNPDPDLVSRPVVVIGATGIVTTNMDQQETDFHRHRKGQLMLTLRGVLTCEVENNIWIAPAQSAIWVPGNVLHKIKVAGTLDCYIAFIEPTAEPPLPANGCALSTTPLLRELLIRAAELPLLYPQGGMESHLVTLLLDEIAVASTGHLYLPVPTNMRLRMIADRIIDTPSDRGTIQTWAREVGMSERTLTRLFVQETGMSFGRWRQRLHLMLAVKWLGTGHSVQQVSNDLGYESTSSFVSMFRKALGTSPGRYITERRS